MPKGYSVAVHQRYQRRNQRPYIKEGETIQWPKEKEQKYKQWYTKHCTENRFTVVNMTWLTVTDICITNDHGYVLFIVIKIRSFTQS
jgi:hypothetical protein